MAKKSTTHTKILTGSLEETSTGSAAVKIALQLETISKTQSAKGKRSQEVQAQQKMVPDSVIREVVRWIREDRGGVSDRNLPGHVCRQIEMRKRIIIGQKAMKRRLRSLGLINN